MKCNLLVKESISNNLYNDIYVGKVNTMSINEHSSL